MSKLSSQLSAGEKKLIKRFQQQEITGSIIYKYLAEKETNIDNRKILDRISADEIAHYKIYKELTGVDIKPKKLQVFLLKIFAWILGPTFALKFMEKSETDAQDVYSQFAHLPEILSIIHDEEIHEKKLISMIREDRINYMGSVVLGLNDALVELTGALAGFTFALQNPKLIALTGSITGIAAAFSMAASEYLSTKSEDAEKHAVKASVYTGIAYLITVIILILPFILIGNIFISLGLTLLSAIVIIAAFNYYYSIVKEEKFIRRFGEMVILSMGVAMLSFAIGILLRKYFGIEI